MTKPVSLPCVQGCSTSVERKSAVLKSWVVTASLFVGAFGAAPVAQAAPSWSGTYIYEEDGGRTAGGTAISITHELHLWRTNGVWMGRLESNGYQTYINAVVSGGARGNQFDVFFKSRAADTVMPQAKRGDRLFTLVRRSKGQLQTRWGVFGPVTMEKTPAPGLYFRRKNTR